MDEKGRVTTLKGGTAVISTVMENGIRTEYRITMKIAVDHIQSDSTVHAVFVTNIGDAKATVYSQDATS